MTLVLLLLVVSKAGAATKIDVWAGNWNSAGLTLLELLLNETRTEYGNYTLNKVEGLEQARAQRELVQGRGISVLMFATNAERERLMLPIRIPLTNGMANYRICMIKQGQQSQFDGIASLSDWNNRNLIIGQGHSWPDVEIFRANKLAVVTTARPYSLAGMLQKRRFDCAARAVFELSSFPQQGVAVEKTLVFYYQMPSFLFVNKANKALFNRLSLGFERIKRNGKFAAYIDEFYLQPSSELSLKERKVLKLNNPYLTPETMKALALSDDAFTLE